MRLKPFVWKCVSLWISKYFGRYANIENNGDLGWGLLSRFPSFRYFPNYSAWSKHTLDIEYHVYIWQVSPQLSCDDTCQIWKWFKESNRYFWKIENFAYGEINERNFSNPHPRAGVKYVFVFANTNTNKAYLYLYLYLIKFQTTYLYLYLTHRIWCIWQIRLQIHFILVPFSKHKFIEHKFTRIYLINM